MCACGMAGEHMASPIIAFLAGAGTGYLKQRDVEDQRKRDEEDQQFKRDQQGAWRKLQAEADSLKTNLKNAQAGAEVVEGGVGDQSAGPPVPSIQSPPSVVAAGQPGTTGQPEAPSAPVTTMAAQVGNQPPAPAAPPVFRMVAPGGVNRTFNSAAEANKAAEEYSSPAAMNARFVAAYRAAGQLDKAQELENSFKRGQFSDLQFSEAQKASVAKDADSKLRAALGGGAQGLSSFASETGLFGGAKVGFDTGKDGRVQFYTLGADGTKALLGQPVNNTQEALTALVSPHWKSLDTSHYLELLHRNTQAERAQANSDRTFALSERKVNADISARNQQLSIARGKASGKAAAPSGIDLLEGFDPQKALEKGKERAAKLAEDARANGKPLTTAQETQIAQEYAQELRGAVYRSNVQRQNEEHFAAMARLAKTPEQVEAVRAAGQSQGMPAEVMGRIDPRLAPAPEPKKATSSEPAKKAQQQAPKAERAKTPVVPALQVGNGLQPPAALESASARVDKAQAALAAIRASRAPSLRDGNAAREAHAQKIKAAQDELDAANQDYRNAVPPFVGAAYAIPRK